MSVSIKSDLNALQEGVTKHQMQVINLSGAIVKMLQGDRVTGLQGYRVTGLQGYRVNG